MIRQEKGANREENLQLISAISDGRQPASPHTPLIPPARQVTMDEDPEMPELLATLLEVTEDIPYTPDEDLSPYYTRKWGFNIYRTAYSGPESDRAWEGLVDDVRAQIRHQLERRYDNELEVESAKEADVAILSQPALRPQRSRPQGRELGASAPDACGQDPHRKGPSK